MTIYSQFSPFNDGFVITDVILDQNEAVKRFTSAIDHLYGDDRMTQTLFFFINMKREINKHNDRIFWCDATHVWIRFVGFLTE